MPTAHFYDRIAVGETDAKHRARIDNAIDQFNAHQAERFSQGEVYTDSTDTAALPLLQRPGAGRLSECAEAGDLIIIANSATAFVNTKDLVETVRNWTCRKLLVALLDIHVSNTTETSTQAFDAMLNHAKVQVRRRSEQAQRGIATRRATGCAMGKEAGHGFIWAGPTRNRRRKPNPEDRRQMAKIVALRDSGMSWYETARRMMLDGELNPRTGIEWSRTAVARAVAAEYKLREREHREKQCSACHQMLPNDCFHANASNPNQRHTECKDCRSTKRRGVRQADRQQAVKDVIDRIGTQSELGDVSPEDRATIAKVIKTFGGEKKLAREFQKLYEQAPDGSQQKARMLFKILKLAGV